MEDLCGEVRNATFLLGMLARKRIKDPAVRLEVLNQAGRIDKALLKYQLQRKQEKSNSTVSEEG